MSVVNFEFGTLIHGRQNSMVLLPAPLGSEDACYAAADGSDTGIMARGSVMLPEYADPWRKAAAQLTSTQRTDWIVWMHREYPVRL